VELLPEHDCARADEKIPTDRAAHRSRSDAPSVLVAGNWNDRERNSQDVAAMDQWLKDLSRGEVRTSPELFWPRFSQSARRAVRNRWENGGFPSVAMEM